MEKKIIVAVDGHSSCGKSTMAKALARRYSYLYIDSGAMYRAVALYCLRQDWMPNGELDEKALAANIENIQVGFCTLPDGSSHVCLNGEDVEKEIRGMEVSNAVSKVSAVPMVREAMVDLQRKTAAHRGVVMDGRDIGTVVFPDAELKIFVTADASVRARRRYDELMQKGEQASYEEILSNIQMRDRLDLTRPVSPLRKADDALVLDNGEMSIEQQNAWLNKQFEDTIHGRRR